jgi:hypothetical protein
MMNLRYTPLEQGEHLFEPINEDEVEFFSDHDDTVRSLNKKEFIMSPFQTRLSRLLLPSDGVLDEKSFFKYFNAENGKWHIEDYGPIYMDKIRVWEMMFINFWFEKKKIIVPVRISSVFDKFSIKERH